MRNRDIIKQYVNTGAYLPEYQVNKLNNSLFLTYVRKLIIDCDYSFDLKSALIRVKKSNDYIKTKTIEYVLNNKKHISIANLINYYEEKHIEQYIDGMIETDPTNVAEYYLKFMNDDKLNNFIDDMVSTKQFRVLRVIDLDNITNKIIERRIINILIESIDEYNTSHLRQSIFDILTDEQKLNYINKFITIKASLNEREILFLKSNHMSIFDNYIEYMIKNNKLTFIEYRYMTTEQMKKYIDDCIEKGKEINTRVVHGDELEKYYLEKTK